MKKALWWLAILSVLDVNVALSQILSESDLSNTNGYYYKVLNGKQKADTGDFDGAIILLTKAIELKPDGIDAYGYRGWAEYSKGDYDKAIADYTKCAKLQPDDFAPYMYRGWAEERKGDHDAAIADYTKIIKHEQSPTALWSGAYFNRGEARKNKGDFDGAITDLTTAIEHWSDVDFSACLLRGEAKEAKGDLTGAIADGIKAIESGRNLSPPQYAEAYNELGCMYYDQHSFTNALVNFQKASENSPSDDYIHFRIWLVKARLNERAEATKELQEYVQSRTGKPNDWPAKIGSFLIGELAESALFKNANNSNTKTANDQLFQAYFFAGTKRLIEKDNKVAMNYFRRCLATDKINSTEYWSASADLKFLKSER
jgi:tetratricopeptide (TPR) repeat protein